MTPERIAAELERTLSQVRQISSAEVLHPLEVRLQRVHGGALPQTPQELLAVADVIAAEMGLLSVVGRSLRLQALLWGATTVPGWAAAAGTSE